MKIGNRVKVSRFTDLYYHFFDATGTIIAEYTTRMGVHKFVVLFDHPITVPDCPDPVYGGGDMYYETFAFVNYGLDLLEE